MCYPKEADYRRHFESKYCVGPITTFDGIQVFFRKRNFDHAFYETVRAQDDIFSWRRAERIDWIDWALANPNAELYQGWDAKRRRIDESRRVAIVNGDYVVVIRMTGKTRAEFVTAFEADNWTVGKIRLGAHWVKRNR